MGLPTHRVITGIVREVLPTLEPCSFDACLCDPPYGLGFMGKEWDHGVPGKETWEAVYHVLKPGANLLAFGGTRTHHRLMCAIEDAGFEVRDCLMWLYGSGFPKSMDIGKMLDKRAGTVREIVGRYELPDVADGRRKKGWACTNTTEPGMFGSTGQVNITAPATDAAKLWDGYGTALKPAWEIILLAMKPCEGTFAENALKWGVAGLNIDAGRIPTSDPLGGGEENRACFEKSDGWNRPWMQSAEASKAHCQRVRENVKRSETLGRWPANLLLDEEAAEQLDAQSGDCSSPWIGNPNYNGHKGGKMFGGSKQGDQSKEKPEYRDSGGASRFFYCAKASRSERGTGNTHPTVKPLELCGYLARLILPPERDRPRRLIVPFSGSGSEMIGALRAGWDEVIGIESDIGYAKLSRERITSDAPLFYEEPPLAEPVPIHSDAEEGPL